MESSQPDGKACGVVDLIGDEKQLQRLARFGAVEATGEETAAGDPVWRLHVSQLWHFYRLVDVLSMGQVPT